jgi:hypothetical protein
MVLYIHLEVMLRGDGGVKNKVASNNVVTLRPILILKKLCGGKVKNTKADEVTSHETHFLDRVSVTLLC